MAICENSPAEASKDFWAVAWETLAVLLVVKQQETDTSQLLVDFVMSISCQSKYLP